MPDEPEINIIPGETVPVSWIVEQIGADHDGGIDTTIFTGPFAHERARGYAALLRHDPDRLTGY